MVSFPARVERRTLWLLGGFALAALLWAFLLGLGWPLASSSALGFGLVLASASPMLSATTRRFGVAAAVLAGLLVVQGLHLLEHVAQLVQYYLLAWPAGRALGLISAFNAEWVHFIWNALVWLAVVFLVWRGLRGPWGYLLLVWATAHGLEHAYLLARYLQLQQELAGLNLPTFAVAQTLPGILGRDGWLALECGRVPGLATASRALVHFWWNMGEFTLLAAAAASGAARLRPGPKETP